MDEGERSPVPYMERTRNYYRALGYDNDYVWATFADVPFARLSKPLSACKIGLVTTAGPADRSNRDARGRKQVWFGPTSSPPTTFDTDLAWDKEATHTDDRETFLPVDAMKALQARQIIGGVTAHFCGAPTDYSHSKTLEHDAPQILDRLRKDGADAALLTAL